MIYNLKYVTSLAMISLMNITTLQAQKLDFKVKEQSATLNFDQELTDLKFTFTNPAKVPIKIAKISAGCNGCLSAKVMGGNYTIKPGETGTIIGSFKASSYTGAVTKGISIWSEGSTTGAPTTTLVCKFQINQMVNSKHRRLAWEKKDEKKVKTIYFSTNNKKPFPKEVVTTTNSYFKAQLQWDDQLKRYSLKVTPTKTGPALGVIKISTGLNATRNKQIRFYATSKN